LFIWVRVRVRVRVSDTKCQLPLTPCIWTPAPERHAQYLEGFSATVRKNDHVMFVTTFVFLTFGVLDGVDGLLPARVLLGPGGEAALLVQVQLEPHGQGVQVALLGDGQVQTLHLPGAQALQLLVGSTGVSRVLVMKSPGYV